MSVELFWPDGRVTINLAPAELKKKASGFDLPIALALLAASRQIPDPDIVPRRNSTLTSSRGNGRPRRGERSPEREGRHYSCRAFTRRFGSTRGLSHRVGRGGGYRVGCTNSVVD